MSSRNIDIKEISISVPNKRIWAIMGIAIVLCNIYPWLFDEFSNIMSIMILGVGVGLGIYGLCLLYIYRSRFSVKKIVINEEDNLLITFQQIRMSRSVNKDSLYIIVKGNVIRISEKRKFSKDGRMIAKIYKNTLSNKKDWDWLIDYLSDAY